MNAAVDDALPLRDWLTPGEVQSVRETFQALAADPDAAAAAFYDRLFELDATLRRHFPDDMTVQREKLMLTLEHTVRYLDSLESVVDEVRALGKRHRAYGARALDYTTVGDALLFTLEQALGGRWTKEAERAWEKTFTVLSQTMQRAARAEEP